MLTKIHNTLFYLFMLMAASSCNQEDADQQILLPSNLEVLVEMGDNGIVNVNFSADKANFYRVGFGVNNQLPELVTGNQVSYRYTSVGEYTITVQAHSTEDDFIKKEEKVLITDQVLGIGLPTTGFESPLEYDGYTLTWNDEFNGTSLSSDWVYDLGDGCPGVCGWGNNELQFYRRENAEVKDGRLIITARQEAMGGKNYTSSRIKTQGKQEFLFGRIDIRAAVPKGQGIWPALWMLGANISEVSWPASGEIDIMEMIGGEASGRDNTVHGTLHWQNNGDYAYQGGSKTLADGKKYADNFHVYSIIWDEKSIAWLIDDEEFHRMDISSSTMDEFRKPFFILINLAVGGNWPGSPDNSTIFPQQFAVDYVRVFEKE
ncbi:glycoside hydrolase family 16 protein [Algoriphagus yeomjeoni]|uniref:Glycosyl hydrolase family 16 n=1 Tax=Algoriphagus yeomjeoni TaxID=291403 RepID=A0A327PKR1_9BACT|nr:glycoside hydrolase family 16 protein [Algoriphagus yeomjeoni]RAI92193.1 glycosyl hydrolase family 16 [Algoriphagus yeomjeoni]